VKVQEGGKVYNQQLELEIVKFPRVHGEDEALDGFREEDYFPCAPRPL